MFHFEHLEFLRPVYLKSDNTEVGLVQKLNFYLILKGFIISIFIIFYINFKTKFKKNFNCKTNFEIY